jgi:hypothetical protein
MAAILPRPAVLAPFGEFFVKRRVQSIDSFQPVIAAASGTGTYQAVCAAAEAMTISATAAANGSVLLGGNLGTPDPIKG